MFDPIPSFLRDTNSEFRPFWPYTDIFESLRSLKTLISHKKNPSVKNNFSATLKITSKGAD